MPYVTEADKLRLDAGYAPSTPGELTYLLTMAILGHDDNHARTTGLRHHIENYLKGRSQFSLYAEVLGSLDAAHREYRRRRPDEGVNPFLAEPLRWVAHTFYRDTVAPYEDKKIAENGDVYPNAKEAA